MTESEVLREIVGDNRRERQYVLSELRQHAAYLSRKMAQLVSEIDSNTLDSGINGLGEVQTQGATIDMLCARFDQLRKTHKDLVALVAQIAQ